MITSIEVYLITQGQGKEAVKFYQEAFNATVDSLVYYGDHWPECPPEWKDYIMNAQLKIGNLRLMLSDQNPQMPYVAGNNMTAALLVDQISAAQDLFDKLSHEAQEIIMPLQATDWSPAYGQLKDRYGMTWQINVEDK